MIFINKPVEKKQLKKLFPVSQGQFVIFSELSLDLSKNRIVRITKFFICPARGHTR